MYCKILAEILTGSREKTMGKCGVQDKREQNRWKEKEDLCVGNPHSECCLVYRY
jgi:hypothetical protein